MNILHWPSSYPDPSRNQPFHCIFIEEHIKSILPFAKQRVLFISPETTLNSSKWHERTDHAENDVIVTRYYFNKKLNLQFLNLYIRFILLGYFLELFFLKKFKPQIIHIHFFTAGNWALFFSKLFKLKIVVTEHWTALIGYPIISEKRFGDAKIVYDCASWVLPVSHHLQKGIETRTHTNISDKCTVIHNSVDPNLFKITPSKVDPHQLITVIRLDEQKDIPSMLKALSIAIEYIPQLHLKIIGSGNAAPFLSIAKDLNIEQHVEFLGPLPKKDIAKLMNESSLFILSSIAENSPCVIGEAHCCGLPVVATDVGGVKELIIEGEIVPPQLPKLLAEKILHQLNKTINRADLAQKAQARFSYNAIGKQIFEVYKKVCAE